MNQGIVPKLQESLLGTDLPEEMQAEIIENFENNDFQNMNDLIQYLQEKNIPMESMEELFENFEEEGVSLRGEGLKLATFDDPVEQAEAGLFNELSEEVNNKSKLDLGQPDLLRQFKPSRPSPFDENM